MIIEFKIICAECGSDVDYDMDLRKETIHITPCHGCIDNAECDGFYQGEQAMKEKMENDNV